MNLYLLQITATSISYDSNDSFLIRARDEAEARWIASENAGDEGGRTWILPSLSTCSVVEPDKGDVGIIISSFNAG